MTLPLSSSPVHLDLGTINEVQSAVVSSLRNQVCEWEQNAIDAANFGDYRAAQQYREWAFACDLAATKASTACSALFHDALTALPIVQDTRRVELPNLSRSPEDRYLDALTVEVASAQPCPFQS
jgi:hypothetical protein